MMSLKTVVGLAVLSKALALPMFYNDRKMGCEIPETGFGAHKAPTMDEAITFMLTDATGTAVTAWEPGMEYTLEVSSYEAPANAWIHSTGGELSSDDVSYSVATCGKAIYSSAPAPSHTVTWTAPAEAGCVTVSSAQATGATAGYNKNMMELCAAGAAAAAPAAGPMAAVPMADEPMMEEPMEAEPVEAGVDEVEDETEEAADDGADAVEAAAGEAEETAEDATSGAAGPAGVLAAVAAAAAVLAAAV